MKLTRTTINNFGYISITIMMGLLLLLWFEIVPRSYTVPFFIIASVLFIARFVMRFRLAQQERREMNKTPKSQ